MMVIAACQLVQGVCSSNPDFSTEPYFGISIPSVLPHRNQVVEEQGHPTSDGVSQQAFDLKLGKTKSM